MGEQEEEEAASEQQQQLIRESAELETPTEVVEETAADKPSEEPYRWPVIQYDVPPYRTYHFFKQFRTPSNPNNFLKGVKWSPDGSCFLACSDDNTFSLYNLPYDESGGLADFSSSDADTDSYAASLFMSDGESVYDYCWYPYMSSSSPETCVFASTTRDHPIHLWDASTGELRCTYRAYDAMDEITAAFSIAFNPAGTKIFAGYNKSIRIFDIHRPGRDFTQHSTLRGNKEGQSGIISSIAFCPSHSGLLATGSYSQTTAIHREDNMELLYVLHGQEGGVTHVQFSKDGNYLYTGGRKDPYILCWDIRKTVDIVYKMYRSSETTNQRIYFDIEPQGQHLGSGGQDGSVHIYNLQTGQWVASFRAASDTVNGFSFHPFLPMAASSSGHRRFGVLDDSNDDVLLTGDENCVSVWSFSYSTSFENAVSPNSCGSNGKSELDEDLCQEL
ncbi:putative pseudouridine-5'-monophosphatase-like isoform 1 [Capsicum annuum]|uniref:telomerase Cajal body protein 1 n=1 Tax=Capsicum annuum TaxID=4072 RepID=UPI0007BF7231|nr:telomerase Cajal body protein 1 [Capsicum annuum]KAF3678894.1 putative pseudouridine-5'-monophosphatase-like isoform 1 [Capsicum annuum]KAF3680934.1 putative pseudouridine-5'-monophosphatase-like isoform 1 [Capsicum annuum]